MLQCADVGYRDEAEQLRARVRSLEGQLEDAEAQIRQLQITQAKPGGFWPLVLGGAIHHRVEARVAGEVDDLLAEDIVQLLRARFASLGQVSRIGSTLTFSTGPPSTQRVVEFSVTSRFGETKIVASEPLGNLAGGLFGGVVGGVGGGGLGFVLPFAVRFVGTGMLPAVAVAWVLLVYAVVRSYFAALSQKRGKQLQAAVDAIAQVISEAPRAGRALKGHARVEALHEDDAFAFGANQLPGRRERVATDEDEEDDLADDLHESDEAEPARKRAKRQ